ncbi:hypothetical protein [Pseudothermotoga thermarum]|nr:hypothetical protein [Pseudothermotoga thermarum]
MEVEAESEEESFEALRAGADIIMLDKFYTRKSERTC